MKGKIIPKTDPESKKLWDSIAEVAAEVATWPAWKKGGKQARRRGK